MLSPEPQRAQSTVSEAEPVRNGLMDDGISSRSAARLRAVSATGGKQSAPKVEPIEIHLSMPDEALLPIQELIAAHERVLRTDGRRALEYPTGR